MGLGYKDSFEQGEVPVGGITGLGNQYLIVGTGGAATSLAPGSDTQVLGISGTTAAWVNQSAGGFPTFTQISAGTNTTAAMVVGTGASLGVSGSGTIAATTATALQTARAINGVNFDGTAAIVSPAIGASGAIVRSDGSAWSATTATYPNTTTAYRILYSSATNTVSEITTAIDGVLITDHANGAPSILANGTAGYVLTANSGAPPSWQATAANNAFSSLTAGTNTTTSLGVLNPTINTDATNTVAGWSTTGSITKNDSNTRTFAWSQIKPTLNTGGSNSNTTLNVLSIDTVNTATTGVTTNLINAAYGGTTKFSVSSGAVATLGSAAIGAWAGGTTAAVIGNSALSYGGTTQYTMLITSGGQAILNAPTGQTINHRVNNVDLGTATSLGWTFTFDPATTITASTEMTVFNINTSPQTSWFGGNLTTERFVRVQKPNLHFAGASTVTNGITMTVEGAPDVSTNATTTNPIALQVGGATTQLTTSNASMFYRVLDLPAHTVTLNGSTGLTASMTAAGVSIDQITLSSASALTATNAASLYIVGAPIGGGVGPTTITNKYSLYAAAGLASFQGGITSSNASAQSTPSNPTGTTDTTGKMMGLAGSITPAGSGKLLITISGDMANDTVSDGASVQIRTGTGSAPANGDALTGTTRGAKVQNTGLGAGDKIPFSLNAVVTGLTVGTAYWIDVGLAAITAGTASIADVSISAVEIP